MDQDSSNVVSFKTGKARRRSGDILALVLAGGRGSRLKGLTDWRAKPAVPFGGNYRLIDFVLSNCVNSGISNIGVITQYKSHSLNKHINKGWQLFRADGSLSLELLPAQQRTPDRTWYSGTADAIYQNLDIIREHSPEHVIILSGDHIYKMNYNDLVQNHRESGAKLTICSTTIPEDQAHQFGVLKVDENRTVTDFTEKPLEIDPSWTIDGKVNISMGIYVFDSDFLYEQVVKDHGLAETDNDFGKDLIPSLIGNKCVSAFDYAPDVINCSAYWRDVGTIDSYYAANMELIGVVPDFNLYDQDWPIRTTKSQLPPAKVVVDSAGVSGSVNNSLIGAGSIISGSTIENSLIATNVTVESGSSVVRAVVLPDVAIGKNCSINKAVIDKGCVIADGTVIEPDDSLSREYFDVSDEGVVLVTAEALRKLQTQINAAA